MSTKELLSPAIWRLFAQFAANLCIFCVSFLRLTTVQFAQVNAVYNTHVHTRKKQQKTKRKKKGRVFSCVLFWSFLRVASFDDDFLIPTTLFYSR